MNTPAVRKLREKLKSDRTTHGVWVTLESASVTEMAVALGLDWVVIDAEHGHLDWRDILAHVRATVRSDTVALVRLAELNAGLIKRALDVGADGVVIPWMETPEQLKKAVAYAHYPPDGARGVGGERATCWGTCLPQHVKEADENVIVMPIIESVTGGRNVDRLCQVEGVDMFFLGPADYSSTAGFPGQWQGGNVAAELLSIKDTIRKHSKSCGVMVTGKDDLLERQRQGFRMLSIGLDGGLLVRAMKEMLGGAGLKPSISPSFIPETETAGRAATPLDDVPNQMKPDRPEVINPVGSGKTIELVRGVSFEGLVGAHNGARNLTTGIVTFEPGANLPYHLHPFSESITLLEGRAMVEVEGRRYTLNVMDNVVIPRGTAHYAANVSQTEPAKFHIAMASDSPTRELVNRFFSKRAMADDSTGTAGAERVNRFATAPRFEAGPNATFIDFFNRDLMPGIEMSGGHGVFQPGGRLPCHIHDFDESICIIEGVATCIVEGRKHPMRDCSTALQPRGRCHYFINESKGPMAMLWVYAGPLPERIVMRDDLCTIGLGKG